jgi:chemotaxis protein MotB
MTEAEFEALKKRLEFSERKRAFLQQKLSQPAADDDTMLWSFVDLLTLLLILFILFCSQAVAYRPSENKLSKSEPQLAEAAPALAQTSVLPAENAEGVIEAQKIRSNTTSDDHRHESMEHLRRQVLQEFGQVANNDFVIHLDQKRLVLVLGEKITFHVGDADLLPDFQPTLKRIAQFIAMQNGFNVAVAGHTDDTPIQTPRFPSNWELSAARAVNVARFLIAHGVTASRVFIEGYSSYRPLFANAGTVNRNANRRVEITLFREDNSP